MSYTINLEAPVVNIVLQQGTTLKLALRHVDPVTGDPVDMAGVVPVWVFEDNEFVDLTLGNGLTWGESVGESGITDVLYVNKIIGWADNVKYELNYTYPSGDIVPKLKGRTKAKLKLDPDE